MDVTWTDDQTIEVAPPKKPKILSGTRFASVLGLNTWSTPFQVWCEVTKTYAPPFEDTIYTLAGKAIEPKQIQYMRDAYGMDDLVDPTDEYGKDYFKKTWGNFFKDPVFGGMWDAITKDENGNVTSVLEFKTTKRAEDWADDVPEYYALQAALYAYLLNCDEVIMVASFLQPEDYEHPEDFEPNAENTSTFVFNVSERYPNFEEDYIEPAIAFYENHVLTGISPEYDEHDDADYLKELRNTTLNNSTDIDGLLDELVALKDKRAALDKKLNPIDKREKEIKSLLKKYAEEQIGDNDTARIENGEVICTFTKTTSVKPNEKAMRDDGVWEKYALETESSRFTVKFVS